MLGEITLKGSACENGHSISAAANVGLNYQPHVYIDHGGLLSAESGVLVKYLEHVERSVGPVRCSFRTFRSPGNDEVRSTHARTNVGKLHVDLEVCLFMGVC